jgi:hypothetical protein
VNETELADLFERSKWSPPVVGLHELSEDDNARVVRALRLAALVSEIAKQEHSK